MLYLKIRGIDPLKTYGQFGLLVVRGDGIVLPVTSVYDYEKRHMQQRHWLFTLNNPSLLPDEYLEKAKAWQDLRYIIFQLERGEQGTEHYQGYVIFGKRRTLASLKKEEAGAHWEPRKGTSDQARAYCSKEETRVSGPYEFGDYETGQGTRTDLKQAIAALRDGGIKRVREEYPDTYVKYSRGLHNLLLSDVRQRDRPREVSILYGPPGCGKTRYFYDREPDGCSIPCDHGFWFDGYEGQRAVLLDDFDGRASKWPLNSLLRVIDRYVFLVPIKGSFVVWNPDRIYITTNIHPRQWYDWSTREQQYPALIRRFTMVFWWKQSGTESTLIPRPDVDNTDEEQWKHFWNPPGPRGGYIRPNGHMEIENTVDPYDF